MEDVKKLIPRKISIILAVKYHLLSIDQHKSTRNTDNQELLNIFHKRGPEKCRQK